MSFFENVEMAPPDPILGLTAQFLSDRREEKINLGVGTYKTADLKPYLLPSVRLAEKQLAEEGASKEYLPIEGEGLFLKQVKRLVLGEKLAVSEGLALVQGIGGTGALSIGARFLKKIGFSEVYITNPTWDNHRRLFEHAGFSVESYPYYDFRKASVDMDSILGAMRKAPARSLFVIQPSTHNPTGCDPTQNEWQEILKVMKEKNHLPFFDFCYQGFGEGVQEDARVIRTFIEEGMECLVAISFSKSFGLYAERVGALMVVGKTPESAKRIESQLKVIIRGLYSNPPCHGARIVAKILADPLLEKQWEEELVAIRRRLTEMRSALVDALKAEGLSQFSFFQKQKGLFTFTGLSEAEVERLNREFAIHLPKNGRINIAGLNIYNVGYVAKSIARVLNA